MASASIWPLLLGTGVLFGLGLPLSQFGAREGIDVLAFALWPTLAAALGLAALGWWRHGPLRVNVQLLRFGLLAGTFGHAVPASAGFWLARETGAGFAALAYTLPPVLTLTLSLLLGIEQPAARRLGAVTLGLGGALLLVVGRGAAFDVGAFALAVMALIPLSIAAANLYRARHLPRAVPAEWLAALMLFSSAAVLAASSALHGEVALPLRGDALVWPLAQAGAMMGGYLLFFTLQRRAEPVTLSFVGYVSMATGMAVAALGFGERLPAIVWPALALIVASMWLLQPSSGNRRFGAPAPAAVPARPKCAPKEGGTGDWLACGSLACA